MRCNRCRSLSPRSEDRRKRALALLDSGYEQVPGPTQAYLQDAARRGGMDTTALAQTLATKLGVDQYAATEILWQTYHPWVIWIILGAIGLASLFGMVLMARNNSKRQR